MAARIRSTAGPVVPSAWLGVPSGMFELSGATVSVVPTAMLLPGACAPLGRGYSE